MKYEEALGTIHQVQVTLETLAVRINEPELKTIAGQAARRLESARAALALRDDRRGFGGK